MMSTYFKFFSTLLIHFFCFILIYYVNYPYLYIYIFIYLYYLLTRLPPNRPILPAANPRQRSQTFSTWPYIPYIIYSDVTA